jgi:hypothetical protein
MIGDTKVGGVDVPGRSFPGTSDITIALFPLLGANANMSKVAMGTSLAVAGVLMGALAGIGAEHLAGRISEAVLITRAESAVKRMFAHPELIRFEAESTRIVERENERFVCGWLNLGPRGQNGTYRHPRRAFTYRVTSEDGTASVLKDYSPSEISQIRDPHSPCGIGGEWIYGNG